MTVRIVAFYILSLNFVGLGWSVTLGGLTVDALLASGVESPAPGLADVPTLVTGVDITVFIAGWRLEKDRGYLTGLVEKGSQTG